MQENVLKHQPKKYKLTSGVNCNNYRNNSGKKLLVWNVQYMHDAIIII